LRRGQTSIADALSRFQEASSAQRAEAKEALRGRVNSLIDFEELARRALGRHFSELKTEQQQRFQTAVKQLVEAAYLARVGEQSDLKVEFKGERALVLNQAQPPKSSDALGGIEVQVETSVSSPKGSLQIDYRLYQKNGHWFVYDILTDGLSMLESYRSQFGQLIKKKGFEGLLNTLEKKRSQLAAKTTAQP